MTFTKTRLVLASLGACPSLAVLGAWRGKEHELNSLQPRCWLGGRQQMFAEITDLVLAGIVDSPASALTVPKS